MRETQTLDYCDWCYADGGLKTYSAEEHVISIDGCKPRRVMACDTHVKIIAEFASIILDHGELVLTPVRPKAASPRGPLGEPYLGARAECPVCHQEMTAAYIPAHIPIVHLGRKPTPKPTVCPECGWKPPRTHNPKAAASSVGNHRVHKHDVNPIKEAYEEYLAAQNPPPRKRAARK